MIKKFFFFIIIIFIFYFFYAVLDNYFSENYKKQISLNRSNINKIIAKESVNVPFLLNDTNDVIEFNSGYNNKNNSKPKRNFWKLFKNK